MTTEDTAIKSGTTWIAMNGKHEGMEVIVDRETARGNIKVKGLRATGAAGHAGAEEGEWIIPRDQFMSRFAPQNSNGTAQTQPAYHARPRRAKRADAAEAKVHLDPSGLILPGDIAAERIVLNGVVIEVLDISPSLARAWMDRTQASGFANRPLRKVWVEALTGAIRRNEWHLTYDTIKQDKDGNVVDGQHRLVAIGQSYVTCRALVVRGVEPDAFAVMDTGRGRTVGDVLHLHGVMDRFAMAGTARLLLLLESFGRPIEAVWEARGYVTPANTLAYLRDHPEVEDGVKLGHSIRKYVEGAPGIWGAACTLMLRADADQAETFGHLVRTGEGLQRGHPVLALRKRLLAKTNNITFTRDRYAREELMAIIIKAWNAYRQDEEIETLRYSASGRRPEPFPTAV